MVCATSMHQLMCFCLDYGGSSHDLAQGIEVGWVRARPLLCTMLETNMGSIGRKKPKSYECKKPDRQPVILMFPLQIQT